MEGQWRHNLITLETQTAGNRTRMTRYTILITPGGRTTAGHSYWGELEKPDWFRAGQVATHMPWGCTMVAVQYGTIVILLILCSCHHMK